MHRTEPDPLPRRRRVAALVAAAGLTAAVVGGLALAPSTGEQRADAASPPVPSTGTGPTHPRVRSPAEDSTPTPSAVAPSLDEPPSAAARPADAGASAPDTAATPVIAPPSPEPAPAAAGDPGKPCDGAGAAAVTGDGRQLVCTLTGNGVLRWRRA